MNRKVTYSDIVNALSKKTGFSKQKSEAFVKTLLNQVKDELKDSGKASITNFGSFKVKNVAEREGKNPQTGDPITIPAHKRVSFSPYKSLRESVNAKYNHLESELIDEEELDKADEDTPELIQELDPKETAEADSLEEKRADDVFAISTDADEDTSGTDSQEPSDAEETVESGDQIEKESGHTPDEVEKEIKTDETETRTEDDVEPDSAFTDSGFSVGEERSYTKLLSLLAVLMLTIIAITTVWFLVDNGAGNKKVVANDSHKSVQAGTMVQEGEAGQTASLRSYESIKSEADELEKRINVIARQTEKLKAQQNEQNERTTAAEINSTTKEVSAKEPSVQVSETKEVESNIQSYQVQQGEWYWVISKKLYGKPHFWPLLFMENHAISEDPDSLLKLTSISVPDMEGTAENPTKKDYKDLAGATKMVAEAYENAGKTEKANEYKKMARMWEKMGV